MRVLWLAALVAVASALVVSDDRRNDRSFDMNSLNMANMDVKMREMCVMKLLNHILQPTVYEDIRTVAREWNFEGNLDKYLKVEVVKDFLRMMKVGMLPRGEVFVHTNDKHMEQAVRVFRLMYFAKDFDVFMRTASWLRERINGGMFVYCLTACCFHREDCRGITLPAPYEIYPYFFVDNHVINKAHMMKMMKNVNTDPVLMDYLGIRKVNDKNVFVLDWHKGVRHTLNENDRVAYFTEDVDLNTYMYYLHMTYPYWMTDEAYGLDKERRGETLMYANQQLLARYRLERLSQGMCDIKMLTWSEKLQDGYWPKLRLHNGEDMPARMNDIKLITKDNIKEKLRLDDFERIIRDGIITGRIDRRDGQTINIRKPEDIELLSRFVLGGMNMQHDSAKTIHMMNLFKRILSYNRYNQDKDTYIPTALDMYTTCLRDPVFWRIMKRVTENAVLFKKLLPKYNRDELDFPGVKVEKITTDKLTTFMDEFDLDITNAVYLDDGEMKKQRADNIMLVRQRRMNHHPFKVSIDVVSDKAVDCVVRVFIGPKYDCMGRLIDINDKRLDMVEIDSFLHKLDTGMNNIVRDSTEMHGVIEDRPWTRVMFDRVFDTTGNNAQMVKSWWHKSRTGFPHRLLLPMGHRGGLPLTIFVVVSPVRTNQVLPSIDMNIMKQRRTCRWTTCIDTMPLGFPFDREIDVANFFTKNMRMTDVMVFRKDMETANMSKDIDTSEMVMKRDDLTWRDRDQLVRRSNRYNMMTGNDNMQRN